MRIIKFWNKVGRTVEVGGKLQPIQCYAAANLKLSEWLTEYHRLRTSFGACRHICTIGRDQSDPIIQYHDQATGAFSGLKLA